MSTRVLSIVWFDREPAQPAAQPVFHEQPHSGELDTALAQAVALSRAPGFLLGQVLAAGRVLATVAHAGAYRLNPSA